MGAKLTVTTTVQHVTGSKFIKLYFLAAAYNLKLKFNYTSSDFKSKVPHRWRFRVWGSPL